MTARAEILGRIATVAAIPTKIYPDCSTSGFNLQLPARRTDFERVLLMVGGLALCSPVAGG